MQAAADTSIACNLPPTPLAQRVEWIRRVTAQSLLDHQQIDSTLQLSYRKGALADLERIVASERECCSFLHYALVDQKDSVCLTIVAPPGLGPAIRWLFEQFLPQGAAPASPLTCGCAPGACGRPIR